jgi:hypothetical protein
VASRFDSARSLSYGLTRSALRSPRTIDNDDAVVAAFREELLLLLTTEAQRAY